MIAVLFVFVFNQTHRAAFVTVHRKHGCTMFEQKVVRVLPSIVADDPSHSAAVV